MFCFLGLGKSCCCGGYGGEDDLEGLGQGEEYAESIFRKKAFYWCCLCSGPVSAISRRYNLKAPFFFSFLIP